MDRFEEMRAFTAVVDAGSFVRAAEALQVSKTAVSRLVGPGWPPQTPAPVAGSNSRT